MLFEVYKRGQGSAARIATAIGLGLFALFGLYDLHGGLADWEATAFAGIEWRTIVLAILAVGCAFGIGWIVNGKRATDFLIVTEAELRKVSWPSRRELQRQTVVVIMFSVILGTIIFLADILFVYLSRLLFVS